MSKTHLRLTVLVVLVAVAAVVALRWSQVSRSSSPTIDRDALLHLVNARTDAYNLSNTQAQAAFASVVSQDVEAAFNAILAKVPEAGHHFLGDLGRTDLPPGCGQVERHGNCRRARRQHHCADHRHAQRPGHCPRLPAPETLLPAISGKQHALRR